MSDFDSAKLYDVDPDAETLTHESPWDALDDHLDAVHPHIVNEPVTVYAFVPEPVPDAWAADQARRRVEEIVDSLGERYGSPEEDPADMFDGSGLAELEERIRFAIQHAIDCHLSVRSCRRVGHRTYSDAEVRELYAETGEEPSR